MRQFIYSSAIAISALYAGPSLASDYCDDLFNIKNDKNVEIKFSDLHSFTMPQNMHKSKSGYNYSGRYVTMRPEFLAQFDQLMRDGQSQETCIVSPGSYYSMGDLAVNNINYAQLIMSVNVFLPSRDLTFKALMVNLIRSKKNIDHLAFKFERPQFKAPENNKNVESSPESLPDDFDPEAYLHFNPDVLKAAQNKGISPNTFAKSHYLKDGWKEGRQYKMILPADFNADAYLNINGDVRAAQQNSGKSPEQFAREHYFNHGKNEGRRYK